MGNINYIFNKEGEHIGIMNVGLRTFFAVNQIICKYVPDFNFVSAVMNNNINEQLEVVYNNCSPSEDIMMLMFINDTSEFDESNLPAFDDAIADFPKDWPPSALQSLEDMRELIKEHKWLRKTYQKSTMQTTVVDKDGSKTMEVGVYEPND